MDDKRKKRLDDVVDQNEDGNSACQFVYTLYKEVRALMDGADEFEVTDLILRVNDALLEFIDNGHYKSDKVNEPWNIEPQLPVCVDQLTRKLIFKKS
jgi:hypothetical protein